MAATRPPALAPAPPRWVLRAPAHPAHKSHHGLTGLIPAVAHASRSWWTVLLIYFAVALALLSLASMAQRRTRVPS